LILPDPFDSSSQLYLGVHFVTDLLAGWKGGLAIHSQGSGMTLSGLLPVIVAATLVTGVVADAPKTLEITKLAREPAWG